MNENPNSHRRPSSHEDKIANFLLGSDVQAMKDLPDNPDLQTVYEGVNLKISLGNMLGGWELGPDGPQVVWFVLVKRDAMQPALFQRLEG